MLFDGLDIEDAYYPMVCEKEYFQFYGPPPLPIRPTAYSNVAVTIAGPAPSPTPGQVLIGSGGGNHDNSRNSFAEESFLDNSNCDFPDDSFSLVDGTTLVASADNNSESQKPQNSPAKLNVGTF